MVSLSRFLHSLFSSLHIVYAFTKSDITTILGPVIFYALVSSPAFHYSHMPVLVGWVWIYLLQFCTSNQVVSVFEDNHNKPDRPIPAGLISIQSTQILRWSLFLLCLWSSWYLQVLLPGILMSIAFILYNEMHYDSHWLSKNILNSIGIVSFNTGAAAIAQGNAFSIPDTHICFTSCVNLLLIASTIQVQDFRDVVGDRIQGRATLPAIFPNLSRIITSILISVWSFELSILWRVSGVGATIYVIFGLYISGRIEFQRSQAEDKCTLGLYMVSDLCVYCNYIC
ncbi:UbiA prenyltransferase family [Lentinula lateritia]|nr:UbiA prenyltransferase family [Lentinula lateritia]